MAPQEAQAKVDTGFNAWCERRRRTLERELRNDGNGIGMKNWANDSGIDEDGQEPLPCPSSARFPGGKREVNDDL